MEKFQLLHGVEVNGTVHFNFAVRLPVVRDTITALQTTSQALGTTDGAAAGMYYRVAVLAAGALTSLGDLTTDDITPDLLLDGLSDEDYDLIDAQIEALKKKRIDLRASSQATGSPSSLSDDTASPNSK